MFEDFLSQLRDKFIKNNEEINLDKLIDIAVSDLIENFALKDQDNYKNIIASNDAFIKRNREKWSKGFIKLHALREICLDAGINFQKQFLKNTKYHNDELIGVFMRQHVHACRISGEIICLLEGGYPDAALARWRTLYEMVIQCLIIQKHGREAAIDFIKYGLVKTVEGIEEHHRTAEEMGHETFTDEELNFYFELRENLIGNDKSWHWARKYTGVAKIEKLREYVGLDKWSHNYKLASRNIHADYYEVGSLYAMQEAKEDVLLVGQSNSGLTEPAHFTAISLSQITAIFLTAYIEDDESELDYTDSLIFIKIIQKYEKQVGEAFLERV
ncbi:DUF5677 domain-containing protein [Acinetobacter indicus]|uniref:DUF5677 domain-containing protein n=1 Tax=Acinetobacter indicus TaxID=756892 RepID=UPI0032B62949